MNLEFREKEYEEVLNGMGAEGMVFNIEPIMVLFALKFLAKVSGSKNLNLIGSKGKIDLVSSYETAN